MTNGVMRYYEVSQSEGRSIVFSLCDGQSHVLCFDEVEPMPSVLLVDDLLKKGGLHEISLFRYLNVLKTWTCYAMANNQSLACLSFGLMSGVVNSNGQSNFEVFTENYLSLIKE